MTTPITSRTSRLALAALALLLLALLVAGPGYASQETWKMRGDPRLAASAGAEPPLRVRITSRSKRAILRGNRIKVFVEVTQPQIVRFTSRAGARTQARQTPLTRERQARFVNRSSGTVSLRLTRRGRQRVSECGDLRIIVNGVGRPVSQSQTLVVARSRSYRMFQSQCR